MIPFKQFVEDNLKVNIGEGWEFALSLFEMRGEEPTNIVLKKSDTSAKYKQFNITITDAAPAISSGVELQFKNGISFEDGRNSRSDLAAGGVLVAALKLLGMYVNKFLPKEIVIKARRDDNKRVNAYKKMLNNTGMLSKIHESLSDFRLLRVIDKDDFTGEPVDPQKIIFVLRRK
jgi:hypothetical protein